MLKGFARVFHLFPASVDKKMISPHYEWYIGNVLVCAQLFSKLAPIVYAVLRSYLDF